MKKIILSLLILFSVTVNAQTLDTVIVRNLTMQSQEWAFLIGSYNTTADSITMVAYRRIRNKVQEAIPQNWTTNLTVDSLPGKVVIDFYQIAKTSAAGEIATRYTQILNAISSKTNLAYWIGFVDANSLSDFQRKRDRGKNLLID